MKKPLSVIILNSLEIAISEIKKELADQGHNHSGKLSRSIKPHLKLISDGIRGEITMLERYIFINTRTPGARIPFSGRTGRGGKSKFIQALIKYFREKGFANPKRAAFATAYKMKKEGRPTKGSRLFSKNGRRTGFLEHGLKDIEERIYERLRIDITKYIKFEING